MTLLLSALLYAIGSAKTRLYGKAIVFSWKWGATLMLAVGVMNALFSFMTLPELFYCSLFYTCITPACAFLEFAVNLRLQSRKQLQLAR
jgi:hypothetical protein